MRCEKCGFDHENPGGELAAIQVLVCVCSPQFEFVTRHGKIRPMTVVKLDRKPKK